MPKLELLLSSMVPRQSTKDIVLQQEDRERVTPLFPSLISMKGMSVFAKDVIYDLSRAIFQYASRSEPRGTTEHSLGIFLNIQVTQVFFFVVVNLQPMEMNTHTYTIHLTQISPKEIT